MAAAIASGSPIRPTPVQFLRPAPQNSRRKPLSFAPLGMSHPGGALAAAAAGQVVVVAVPPPKDDCKIVRKALGKVVSDTFIVSGSNAFQLVVQDCQVKPNSVLCLTKGFVVLPTDIVNNQDRKKDVITCEYVVYEDADGRATGVVDLGPIAKATVADFITKYVSKKVVEWAASIAQEVDPGSSLAAFTTRVSVKLVKDQIEVLKTTGYSYPKILMIARRVAFIVDDVFTKFAPDDILTQLQAEDEALGGLDVHREPILTNTLLVQ